MRTRILVLTVLLAFTGTAEAGKKKKDKGPSGPTVGWHREAGWTGDCWFPPDFASMPEGPKRMAWQETRDAMMQQWNGTRGDGVKFDEKVVEDLETVILSKPERTDLVARENLEQCKAAMSGRGTGEWESWIRALPAKLTVGECPYPPMDFTMYDYLSINNEWQIRVNLCKGDKILIHGTTSDYYQIVDGGPWINVLGDPAQPAPNNLPCNVEGCLRGQLVMRFTAESGVQQILPVGEEREFLAPDHGRIEVMINDDTLFDNKYKVEKGLEHHTGIEYKPAEG